MTNQNTQKVGNIGLKRRNYRYLARPLMNPPEGLWKNPAYTRWDFLWAAIIMLRRRLVSFSISAAWVRRGDTFPRLKPLLSQTTLQRVLKSTVTGIIMQQSVLYPCSIKTLEVLGNPSPMPKRCPEGRWKWSRGVDLPIPPKLWWSAGILSSTPYSSYSFILSPSSVLCDWCKITTQFEGVEYLSFAKCAVYIVCNVSSVRCGLMAAACTRGGLRQWRQTLKGRLFLIFSSWQGRQWWWAWQWQLREFRDTKS